MIRRSLVAVAVAALAAGSPAAAQEVALKAGLTFNSFQIDGDVPYTQGLIAQTFGAHFRFMLGPVGFQPEINMATRGGSTPTVADLEERIRLEYIEIPVMLVLPFRTGAFEPYVYGGGMVALESRCRAIIVDQGLRTNFGCEQTAGSIFERHSFDYGVAGGAGIARPLGAGNILLEGRYTMGLRDIHEADDAEVRNRSFILSIGYTLNTRRQD